MSILNLLASNSFITVNKELIKVVGIEAALLFGELAGEYVYWVEQNQGESFFSTVENIEEKTTLNDYQQRKAIKVLKDKGLIECKAKGVPAKRYFEIHEDRLFELFKFKFSKNLRSSSEKFKELDLENFQSNNNIENKNIEKEYNNIYADSKSAYESEFNSIWKLYPRKEGKSNAYKAYVKARKDGETKESILDGLNRYLVQIKAENTQAKYIKHGSTWFNQRCWHDEYRSELDEINENRPDYLKILKREDNEYGGETRYYADGYIRVYDRYDMMVKEIKPK